MDELERSGFFKSLFDHICDALDVVSKGAFRESRQNGAHRLALVHPSWFEALPQAERELCYNKDAYRCPWPTNELDLMSAPQNTISMFLTRSATEEGLVDEKAVEAKFGEIGRELFEKAKAGLAARDVAELHPIYFNSTPFTPLERPISFSEYQHLKIVKPDLAKELLDAAPIPQVLPTLQAVVEANDVSFADCEFVLGQHFLGSMYPLMKALLEKGAQPQNIGTFCVPYSSSPLVVETIRKLGIRVESPTAAAGGAPSDIERQMEIGN